MAGHKSPVWAEVNLDAIRHNIKQLMGIISPGTKFMAVVKANAYGHGAGRVAGAALEEGAAYLGVARVTEGEKLRLSGIDAPILVLGYTPPSEYPALLKYNLSQTVYDLEDARELSTAAVKSGKKIVVHVKVDTGMSRLGFQAGEQASIRDILSLTSLPNLEIEGIFTHFATADSQNKDYTIMQWQKFNMVLDALKQEGLEFRYRHVANSAALIDMPETHLDMVRAGIAIYGYYPSSEVRSKRVNLKPAMSIKAVVAHVKRVPPGTGISYGITHITTKDSIVATISAGYADGYSRLLSNRGEVLLHGKRAPVTGRICMDQFMVDVSHIPGVKKGDIAVLMGRQGEEEVTADEIASRINTISYEVLCAISARVPRVYV